MLSIEEGGGGGKNLRESAAGATLHSLAVEWMEVIKGEVVASETSVQGEVWAEANVAVTSWPDSCAQFEAFVCRFRFCLSFASAMSPGDRSTHSRPIV